MFAARQLSCHGDESIRLPSTGLEWVVYQTVEDRPRPLPPTARPLLTAPSSGQVRCCRPLTFTEPFKFSLNASLDFFSLQRNHHRCMKHSQSPAQPRPPPANHLSINPPSPGHPHPPLPSDECLMMVHSGAASVNVSRVWEVRTKAVTVLFFRDTRGLIDSYWLDFMFVSKEAESLNRKPETDFSLIWKNYSKSSREQTNRLWQKITV